MIRYVVVTVVLIAMAAFAFGVNAQNTQQINKGAEQINLDGGKKGIVPFPHHRHQATLGDCLVCHNTFDQEKSSIQKAKAEGQLAKKQVMNKLCIQCHRAEMQAGKKAGPTTCSKCHVKE